MKSPRLLLHSPCSLINLLSAKTLAVIIKINLFNSLGGIILITTLITRIKELFKVLMISSPQVTWIIHQMSIIIIIMIHRFYPDTLLTSKVTNTAKCSHHTNILMNGILLPKLNNRRSIICSIVKRVHYQGLRFLIVQTRIKGPQG